MSKAKDDRGQTVVLTVLALVVLLGMAAMVLDVGAWFHQKRHLQATADAAALAGAQLLPSNPGGAQAQAVSYGSKNGGGVLGGSVTVTSSRAANDTISVKAKKTNDGIFSRILGVMSVDIGATAKARVGAPAQARYVAPMVVNCAHQLIQNCGGKKTPQFNVRTTLNFDPMGAPGAFGMLNLDGANGTVGTSKEADWILKGFDKYLGLGNYKSDPGAKFSSQVVRGALDQRIGTVLLFPVFRVLSGQGQQAVYEIMGWIGFYLESYSVGGNNAVLRGYFTEFIAQGIQASSGQGSPLSFGVRTVQLIG
jgi:Putative Flp pilus-assembly TadE/G-like